MKKVSRVLSVVLSVLMLLSVVGCPKDVPIDDPNNVETPGDSDKPSDPTKPAVIKILSPLFN